ncbi:MAG TPA: TetR family transcriptional regulator [Solirubrobacterales bacterium]|nr:TetR family transcriptional regulator [Solirubrobacterales bacterium]
MALPTDKQQPDPDAEDAPRADARRNREAVIEAALTALAADTNASIADIADAAGVGRTTVYRHFENRDELIVALFQRVITDAQIATAKVIEGGGSVADTLRALGPVMIEIGERFRFLHAHLELGAEALAESKEIPDDPVRLFLVAAQEDGQIRSDAPLGWVQSLMQSSAMAAMDQIDVGALDSQTAGVLLGETFVAALLPR